MKILKGILSLASMVLFICAAVLAVYIYRDNITAFLKSLRDSFCGDKGCCCAAVDEYEDFADV